MSLTRHSSSGKHCRLGHAIEQEKCHAVARSFYLVSKNMDHGRYVTGQICRLFSRLGKLACGAGTLAWAYR